MESSASSSKTTAQYKVTVMGERTDAAENIPEVHAFLGNQRLPPWNLHCRSDCTGNVVRSKQEPQSDSMVAQLLRVGPDSVGLVAVMPQKAYGGVHGELGALQVTQLPGNAGHTLEGKSKATIEIVVDSDVDTLPARLLLQRPVSDTKDTQVIH